ncbi:BCCT family transporter [Arcobacter aquimarinus]|uniref:BCCT (Betaine/carnitine/choline) family transporter n=1 Tax=Arcobacter aquimarinus TaxID=1315211 RepID=A0AAE7B2T3_9BACT|nr:choline BCCT transporter BetT [Arcobacter aquimarinus]QKE26418.1 BCCT (betaine/carnitine/choline) family transporter [Arcobacter aquimarinus]RXI34508.1 choline transporter [Arcobacter aquimarinus]
MENNFKITILKPVFIPSVIFIIALVSFTILEPQIANEVFTNVRNFVADKFGWFYMLGVGIFTLFALFLAVSPFGKFRLGPDQSKPTYSNLSWFAMLFSAGMGIGLMFWSVAEPVMHYVSPPVGTAQSIDSAKMAMNILFFHWGLHAWAIYAIVGLVLAYFSFRHGLPLSIRSALYPLIGDKIYGKIGHSVDTIAVLGTVFGVATSLGFGVLQINSGLNYLFEIPVGITTQIILIALITAIATISVILGLDGGIKRLSELNLYLAGFLLLFIFLAGPTFFLLNTLIQNIGSYLSNIVFMTFNQYSYDTTSSWMSSWTLFYWAWWIAWAPFVGMFIARVSRGRTIREFVIGVLFVPVGFTFIWMTIFGNSALYSIMNEGFTILSTAVSADVSTALFKFLEHFPFSSFVSIIAIILVVTFFVTSSDSGSLVVDTIASGGKVNNPVWQRIFWAISQGVVAIALLLAGGLQALQSASIIMALPFVFVMLIACWGMYKALSLESIRNESLQHHMNAGRHGKISGTWQARLSRIIEFPKVKETKRFINEDVINAMNLVKNELSKYSWNVEVSNDKLNAISIIRVEHSDDFDFIYEVRAKNYDTPSYAYPESVNPTKMQKKYARAEVLLQDGNKAYDIYGYDEDVIATDIIDQFEKHRHFLNNTSSLNPVVPID